MDVTQAQPMRYAALDPLRGLAAVWVFLFHYTFSPAFQARFPLLHTFMKAGDLGVPMFFVISGYCLAMAASQTAKFNRPISGFLYRRTRRIFPTFWCSVIFIVLLRWATWSIARSFNIFYDLPLTGDWTRWVKVVTLTSIFDQSNGLLFFQRFGHVNGAYWTLPIEFQFYLVVCVALLVPRLFYRILAVVTLVAIPCYFVRDWNFLTANRGLFIAHWLQFACGLALYWMLERKITPGNVFGRYAGAVSVVGTLVLGTTFVVLIARKVNVTQLAFAVGFTVFLWNASPSDQRIDHFLKCQRGMTGFLARCLVMFGAMSYSLYLIHNETSSTIAFALRNFLPASISLSGLTIDLSVIFGVIAISYPFYRYCEAPFVGERKNRDSTPSTIPFSLPVSQEPPLKKAA